MEVEISMLAGEEPRMDTGPSPYIEEVQEVREAVEPTRPVPEVLPTAQGEPAVLEAPSSAWAGFQSGKATAEVEDRQQELLFNLSRIQRQTESQSMGLLAGNPGITLGSVPAAEASRVSGQMMSQLGYRPRSQPSTIAGKGDRDLSRRPSGIIPTLSQLSSSSSTATGIDPSRLAVNIPPTEQVRSLTTHKERNMKWFLGPVWERGTMLQVLSSMSAPDLGYIFLHERTRLAEDAEGLLVDPGAFDNLVGQLWVDRVRSILHATHQQRRISIGKLQQTLAVEGVGNG